MPQIAEEGTAEELLAEIHKEKERLVKEGKLKKSALTDSIIFKGDDNKYYERVGKSEIDISDEIPFEIPQSWSWCRLSSVITLLSGRDLTPDRYNSEENGIPYITGASNLYNGVSSTLAVSNIRNRTYTNYEVYLIGYGYGKFKEKIHFME